MSGEKVMVIGLDGATFDVMMPWVEEGKLPHIRGIMQSGVHGPLESTIHPISPQAWTSFFTGKNAGKHGIFDFTRRKPESYEVALVNGSYREGRSLWQILSGFGKRVGVINVPMTYPPEPVNGFLISGMDTPGANNDYTYPADLYRELSEHVGKYMIGQGLWEYDRRGKKRKLLQVLKEMVRLRTDVSLYLLQSRRPDFFIVVFRATDIVQHIFWKHYDADHPLHDGGVEGFENAIYEIYKEVDEAIGRIIETLDTHWTLFLISDHGAGGYSNKGIYLNSWLESEGFLRFARRGGDRGVVLNDRLEHYLLNAKGRLARHIPYGLKARMQRSFPHVFEKVASISHFANIDWTGTRAFSEEINTNIWINLKGRDPCGIVNPEEYEGLRDELIRRIHALKDPDTLRPVFEKVFKREELYEGRFLENAPDLILLQDQSQYELVPRSSRNLRRRKAIKIPEPEEARVYEKPSGGHRLQGILIAAGRHLKRKQRIEKARIIDVAPTILYLMGCPIARDMDGRVIREIMERGFLEKNEITYEELDFGSEDSERRIRNYSQEEQELVEERLKGLGYL